MQYRKTSLFISVILIALLTIPFLSRPTPAHAATLTVTNTNDAGAGSLRQAILDAANGDIIEFGVTGTITLTTGTLNVNKSLTISGPTGGAVILDGNASDSVITVTAGSTVTIENLTIRNGAGINGGGIYNNGTLNLRYSAVLDNVASGLGGGGIYGEPGSQTAVSNSTLSGNDVQNFGGGAFIRGTAQFQYVTITDNFSDGAANGRDSGGIAVGNGGSATIANSILSANYGNSTASEVNCLAAGFGVGAPGTLTSTGYNLVGDGCALLASQPTDQLDTAPGVEALADNGGVTQTHALQSTSGALDAIPTCTGTDQRGISRPQYTGGRCDIGAFELEQTAPDNGGGTVVTPPAATTPSGGSAPVDHSAEDNARAQAPLCQDLDGSTNPIIRAAVQPGTVTDGGVYCRVLAESGVYVKGPEEIGNASVIGLGVLQAVDVFGMADQHAQPVFNVSVKVCLSGIGRLFYLDATTSPRQLSELSTTAEAGYTCGLIANAGTVVLAP
ncbi:choice-of-anchor Q domain-containing protein [Aggregatilinea lenta]|uniref:choice-of-anchor Q domain-containing protein n=1 Tax=Aggregatilinea lenta TaxID=913108 RepID=UPI000E5BA4AD|nr:choice-of-anchor Q domain-containing protein [Aggregatilinea lenta]